VENKLMAFRPRSLAVAAIALSIGATLATNAQALQQRHRHHPVVAHHHIWRAGHQVASRGGDVIVHTGRSYLDPGPSANEGTENRYFYDTAHYDMRQEGPSFTANSGGFENLPTPYRIPGRQEPLAEFE
jgi:hypothetical protein